MSFTKMIDGTSFCCSCNGDRAAVLGVFVSRRAMFVLAVILQRLDGVPITQIDLCLPLLGLLLVAPIPPRALLLSVLLK